MNNPVVIVDADAIVAQAFPDDSNHQLAVKTSLKLNELNAQVIYPVTAILEATTVLQGRLNSSATAYGTARALIADPNVPTIGVTNQIIMNALKHFDPSKSKKNTLFDCVIVAIADEYKADAIFSFDKFYKSKGFKSASDL